MLRDKLEVCEAGMSCGTPVGGGGFMRQRHSQGYTSSGDDLEDDACSTATSPAAPFSRTRTWFEVVENVLWVCSALFVVYFGDRKSNLLYLLCFDDRIRRIPLYTAIVGLILNLGIFFYMSVLAWGMRKSDEELEVLTPSVAPFVTLLGVFSFSLFSFALWPIWGVLTLPLLLTLLMAYLHVCPYLTNRMLRPPVDDFRTD